MRPLVLLLLAGCCGRDAPTWEAIDPIEVTEDERVSLDLALHVDDAERVAFSAEAGDGVLAEIDGTTLTLVPEQGFTGDTTVTLLAERCDDLAATTVEISVGTGVGSCPTELRYTARGGADAVFLAGTFNDWSATATPMALDGEEWAVTVDLPVGAHAYKFVEYTFADDGQQWTCDPNAGAWQCDEGYSWDRTCSLGGASCNSLLVVPDCSLPTLELTAVSVDRDANTLSVEVDASTDAVATLDGREVGAWVDGRLVYTSEALSEGRHAFRVTAGDAEPIYVPFWLDDRDWAGGLMYFVFVDRFADGDASLDASEGTTDASTDYAGGDWQGVIDRLDDLDDLGVTVLWLTAPLDNPGGAWDGTCDATYSGYHGYWPVDADALEEHFGDEAKLRELIDAAHARNMRVITDWVANHVHEDHPWVAEHPDWFNDETICEDDDNWNDIPETCWFASYLPDLRYYEVDPLVEAVDAAVDFARDYELDGYRVDAAKHVPHSVHANLATRVREEIEWVEDFYTVGETFTGDRDLIASYVNEDELDGQFDFPLYWAIVSAFARDEIGLSDGDGSLASELATSQAAWGESLMSTFLGNHDVSRFTAMASGEVDSLYGDSPCADDGTLREPDTAPGSAEPYQRLMLAWTFLLTTEGLPLVYYGDEIGLPGYGDPDNRQMLRFDDDLTGDEAMVRAHVRALGQARRAHLAFSRGTRVEWWGNEAGFWAWARVWEDDAVLVLLNRDDTSRTVENGLAFAGLPEGTWTDVLTGESFASDGDSLAVDVPGLGSRVLVSE